MTNYKTTRKALPPDTAGQRRAVYDAIKAGAATPADLRDKVKTTDAFKGAKDSTLRNNVAFHVSRLRKDGFVR